MMNEIDEAVLTREQTPKDYARMRQELRPSLHVLCDGAGLPIPERNSQEEALALHLIGPYEAAMTEMVDQRTKAGRRLAKYQVSLEQACAKESIVAQGAPVLLEKRLIANPARESLLREQARHLSARIVGGVVALVMGAMFGALEALIEALKYALSRATWVVAPALFTVVVSLVVQTLGLQGPLSLDVIGTMVGRALWGALIVALFACIASAMWRVYKGRGHAK